MDLLLLLLERRQELVSREEIAKRLWSEVVFVDVDAGIHTAILKIRQVLGDSSAESPRFVETVPGKGYRFVAPVDVVQHTDVQSSPVLLPGPLELPETRRHNLPADLTSFVGRRKELEDLRRLLASSRLLSLTGAGGVGKTRLALRLASDVVERISGRRLAGRPGAALGARSGGADDRDRPRRPRGPAAISARRPARTPAPS